MSDHTVRLTDEAWDALYDLDCARACCCPACNFYLPETAEEAAAAGVPMYQPDAKCELTATVESIVRAHVVAALREAARDLPTWDAGNEVIAYNWLRDRADRIERGE